MPPQPNFTPSQAKAISSANTANAIADIVNVGTSIATTIASVNDARKREMFQQNLAVLSNDQQITLAKAINNASSESERLAIISQALTNLSSQRIANLEQVVADQEIVGLRLPFPNPIIEIPATSAVIPPAAAIVSVCPGNT